MFYKQFRQTIKSSDFLLISTNYEFILLFNGLHFTFPINDHENPVLV